MRVLCTGPRTTPFARWTPILKDFSRRISPPAPRFQSRHTSTPFNAASDAFELHPAVRSYRTPLPRLPRLQARPPRRGSPGSRARPRSFKTSS
jgi:hypothetical protein